MKRSLALFTFLLASVITYAQQGDLKIKTTYLDNGMKVVMCEDHSQPEIYGAVYVHVGSKDDPADATGMAHYFEHIMFKGTDKIGTTNWEAEKVYLDSINLMYDKLHETDDIEARKTIQRKINELSIASAEYAIPNETDVILTQMGGKGLNAGTSYDQTMYFNTFPSNQLSKWMDVYVERFRNPVFRLFQSELETVYEEKNMYNDNPGAAYMENIFKEAFGEHPYGRPIVGLTEHLKNPQPSKMREFYNTYYVANNMTLILVGDFDIEKTEPMVAKKFGQLRSGKLPEKKTYKTPEFKEKIVKKVKMTPIKMGVLIFPGVPASHEDNIPLEIFSSLFSNGETGIMDKTVLEGKIMTAMLMPLSLEDNGTNIILYIPKIIGQSHNKAEELVTACLDSIKQGRFSDDLFEATKTNILSYRLRQTESLSKLSNLFLSFETTGKTYEKYLQETERIRNITKEEVIAVAKKYFGKNYISYRSKMGFPKKDKIDKPDWKPIEAKNTEAKSDFAKAIEAEEIPETQAQAIKFNNDILINKVNNSYTLYSSKNPRNDIFEMSLVFKYGTIDNPNLEYNTSYLELQGTQDMNYTEIKLALQKLGANIYFSGVSENKTIINISGFERNLDTILSLCYEKLYRPSNDESKKDLLIDIEKTNLKMMKHDAATWSEAVSEYALYGEKSKFRNKFSMKELQKVTGEELINGFSEILKRDGYILFSGNTEPQDLIRMINKINLVKDNAIKGNNDTRKENRFTESQVFVAHNKKFLQSNIRFFVQGEQLSNKDKAISNVFNKYFGTDMYSIVFQEIRELRSLGYSAYGYYYQDHFNRKPGSLFCFLGTQSDKTIDGVAALSGLITNMPERIEKFNASKDALIMSRASQYYTFRSIPAAVVSWIEEGYDHDPRIETTDIIKKAEYKDIYGFYKRMIKDRPVIIMMSGNMKRIDSKNLENFGKITQFDYKDIFRE